MRCGREWNSALTFRYMIPVPEYALVPATELSTVLKSELAYCEANQNYIKAEAKLLYQLACREAMPISWEHRSCDFLELNSVYQNWTPGFDAGYFLYPKKEDEDMPYSKRGTPYYTKEQYERAKYNSNALEYAKSQGYELVQQGMYFTMKEHDSMVFTPNGNWFWNSRGVHGGALEFQMYYEGKTIAEAVLTLAGEQVIQADRASVKQPDTGKKPVAYPRSAETPHPEKTPKAVAQDDGKPSFPAYQFRLPPKSASYKKLFKYLCGDRNLDKSVVSEMIRQGRLMQGEVQVGTHIISNAIFIYKDPAGKSVGGFQRGMMPLREGQLPYKRDVAGSDKQWGWMLCSPHVAAQEVRVFEGAIDAASDASLTAMKNGEQWKDEPVDRLSLEGLGIKPLENYLEKHPEVQRVTLMLDADEPGRKAAAAIAEKVSGMGKQVENMIPPLDKKDWNEVLIETCAIAREQIQDQYEECEM